MTGGCQGVASERRSEVLLRAVAWGVRGESGRLSVHHELLGGRVAGRHREVCGRCRQLGRGLLVRHCPLRLHRLIILLLWNIVLTRQLERLVTLLRSVALRVVLLLWRLVGLPLIVLLLLLLGVERFRLIIKALCVLVLHAWLVVLGVMLLIFVVGVAAVRLGALLVSLLMWGLPVLMSWRLLQLVSLSALLLLASLLVRRRWVLLLLLLHGSVFALFLLGRTWRNFLVKLLLRLACSIVILTLVVFVYRPCLLFFSLVRLLLLILLLLMLVLDFLSFFSLFLLFLLLLLFSLLLSIFLLFECLALVVGVCKSVI